MKILVITGGVLSGLGKGVAAASIGLLLNKEYKIISLKLDGYLNSDPGTMNPFEHGEVFVLDDGAEVDMDFGHYERFLNISCTSEMNITMGKIFHEIWAKERKGDYLGKTVQLIPHVTDLIKKKVKELGQKYEADILMIELGGTIGDIETELFVEAIRQLKLELRSEDIAFVHLTYVPIPFGVKEQKTKPTQQSVKLLREKGIRPDFILGRCSQRLTDKVKDKMALFSDLNKDQIISAVDVDNIYKIPIIFNKQGLGRKIAEKLHLNYVENERLKEFEQRVNKEKNRDVIITIAGKYVNLEDSYASIIETLKHCDMEFGTKTSIRWLDTSKEIDYDILAQSDGIIVPGGFGERGVNGKIEVIKFIREHNIPFLGICYGMQLAVVEFARNICNLSDAHTTEVEPNTLNPVVSILDEQKNVTNKGGTMRLGSYDAILQESKIKEYYKKLNLYKYIDDKFIVSERHRHRYEVNPKYHHILEEYGLKIVGQGPNGLAEFIELESHPYFVATQGHPELKSKPDKPAPLFYGLYDAILNEN